MGKGKVSSSSAGPGFISLLTLIFITLKLTGYIDWSWWAVLSPIWVTALVVCLLFYWLFK